MPTNKNDYMYKYAKEKLKRIPLDVQKEKYEEIKASADECGQKVNGYIKDAVETKMSEYVFQLNQSINANNYIQAELENALLDNSEALTGYSRESCTNGTYSLILKFKSKSHISKAVIEAFEKILKKHSVL